MTAPIDPSLSATAQLADTTLAAGQATTLTVTFTEAVTDFTNDDVNVGLGTLSPLTSSDGGITYTATFTPSPNANGTAEISFGTSAVSDLDGNVGQAWVTTGYYSVDSTAPTVSSIQISDSNLLAGETAQVTVTFSEAVSGLEAADIDAPYGTLGTPVSANGGLTWTAGFTPDSGVVLNSAQLTLASGAVADAAGNANSGTGFGGYYNINTVRPTGTVSLADDSLKAGQTTTLTVQFSQAVSGLDVADLTAPNGALSGLSSTDGGVTWTATFTPDGAVEDATNAVVLNLSGVANAAGNAGSGSASSANYGVDTVAPELLSMSLDSSALGGGDSAELTIVFSEPVSGLTNAALTVDNGSLSTLTSSDGGVTWSATFTPSASVDDATNVITLDKSAASDAAGNHGAGSGSTANYTVSTAGPSVTSMTLSDSALSAGETATLTIVFSEAVSGLTASDLSAAFGTLAAPSSSDGGVTWTSEFTPTANQDYAQGYSMTLASGAVTNGNGAANASGASTAGYYTVDTKAATATLALADTSLSAGETTTLTVTFSEAVSGFDNADVTVQNGTLSSLSSADGGLTWTGTFTPGAAIYDTTNVATLNYAGILDAAGNSRGGSAQSANYSVVTGPAPTPPAPPKPAAPGTPSVVDGVKLGTVISTGADGRTSQVITIPVVSVSRTDSGGAANLADIPLVKAGGSVLLTAGVPTGIGLQVAGAVAPSAAQGALQGLVDAIEARSADGTPGQSDLTAGGVSFLGTLDGATPLLVQTIVVNSNGAQAPGGPLVISGAPAGQGTAQTAVVIDTEGLPAGAVIELQNVEFAAIIGAASIVGGAGSQFVWGDAAAQSIYLGADDDVLHGGAGDDIVGSAGGNDRIFGDEGNDLVFGGLGDDMIDGGSGRDTVQLVGAGRADYSLRLADGQLVMTHLNGGADGVDTVANVEVLRFTGGAAAAEIDFGSTDVASLVRLYDTAFGRAADEAGINYWIDRSEHGASLQDIAASFVDSSEANVLYGSLDNEAYIAALYANALGRTGSASELAYWVERLDSHQISRGDALLGFADSAENVGLVGVIGTSIVTI